jgi:hypothetical protein
VTCPALGISCRNKSLSEALTDAKAQRRAALLQIVNEDESELNLDEPAAPFKDEKLDEDWRAIPFAPDYEVNRKGEVRYVRRNGALTCKPRFGYVRLRASLELLREFLWGPNHSAA